MGYRILQVGSPFMAAGPGAVGSAAQVIHILDHALTKAGHTSVVVAPEGSVLRGTLYAIPAMKPPIDAIALVQTRTQMRLAIRRAIDAHRPHLVHVHCPEFAAVIPEGIPVLATLDRGLTRYPDEIFNGRRHLTLQCVSKEQTSSLPGDVPHLPPVARGVAIPKTPPPHARRGFALVLGRITPAKGIHIAIDAAKRAGRPLLIAGAPSGRPEDQAYLDAEVLPRLDHARRYLGRVDEARKRRLLSAARCLLLPNLEDGFSGLSAREAMAAGTPVVGFPTGALPSLVMHGHTGFLVKDAEEMAAAMDVIEVLEGEDCRTTARVRFPLDLMIDKTFESYAALIGSAREMAVA